MTLQMFFPVTVAVDSAPYTVLPFTALYTLLSETSQNRQTSAGKRVPSTKYFVQCYTLQSRFHPKSPPPILLGNLDFSGNTSYFVLLPTLSLPRHAIVVLVLLVYATTHTSHYIPLLIPLFLQLHFTSLQDFISQVPFDCFN